MAGVAVSLGALASCSRRADTPTTAGIPDLSARILRDNVIRAAWISYPPYFYRDLLTGEFKGFAYEAGKEMAKNLGLKIEWVEEVFFGTAFEGLKTGRYDVVACTLWPTGLRLREADFCTPMFYSPIGAYVRPNRMHDFQNFDNINAPSVTIATIDGEMAATIAADRFPRAKTLSMPQSTDISLSMVNVTTGKADVAFIERTIAREFLAKNPGTLVNIAQSNPVQVFPNCFAISRNQYGLKNIINGSFEELGNKGQIEALMSKYETIASDCLRIAAPYHA
jgi:ABC-type amino acid transport substrate-binding protein